MQEVIERGISFMGVQGMPDRRMLKLNQQEIALLERAADLADKIREHLRDEDGEDTEWGEEAASMAMRARELADSVFFRVEAV